MAPRPHAPAKIYRAREIPVLNPAPNDNLPTQCREVGTRIGDVGVWRDGGASFEILFNVCLPVDDPLHEQLGVPEGFEPFVLEKKAVAKGKYHSPATVISTGRKWKVSLDTRASNISCAFLTVGGSIQLSFQSTTTTTLALPNGSTRQDLLPIYHFCRYVEEKAESWYVFAAKAGWVLPSKRGFHDALFVVTGCDKTSSWAITTEAARNSSAGVKLTLGFANVGQCTLQCTSDSKESAMATKRVSTNDQKSESQCICVRGFFVRPPKNGSVGKKGMENIARELKSVCAAIDFPKIFRNEPAFLRIVAHCTTPRPPTACEAVL